MTKPYFLPLSVISLLGLANLIICSGCKVGPGHVRPATDYLANGYTDAANPRLNGEPVDEMVWWKVFNDPTLDGLIQTALNQNLGLKEAGQRILEARAIRQATAGNLFPQQQSLNGSYNRVRISENEANFVTVPGFFETNPSFSSFNSNFAAAWELDFWGKYRRMVEAADAKLDASKAGYDLVKVMLIGEVARNYVELRTIEKRTELARRNVEIQGATLLLAEKKLEAGTANKLDYHQSKAILAQTAATLPELEILRRQACHRLCLLLGLPPDNIRSAQEDLGRIPTAPKQIASGIPADLLRRRPDVQIAERELAAQSARIGIAQADFYPQISLSGAIGVGAASIDDLFRSSSLVGRVGPSFSWNLLNYGRIRNRVVAEEEAWQRLVFAYHASVLKAYQEVQDAQISFIKLVDREIDLKISMDNSLEAVKISQTAFEEGATDFDRVYLLQSELVRQQDNLVENQGRVALSLVNLYVALGGGWEVSGCNTAACQPPVFKPAPQTFAQQSDSSFASTRTTDLECRVCSLPLLPSRSGQQAVAALPETKMIQQHRNVQSLPGNRPRKNKGSESAGSDDINVKNGFVESQLLEMNWLEDKPVDDSASPPQKKSAGGVWESQIKKASFKDQPESTNVRGSSYPLFPEQSIR